MIDPCANPNNHYIANDFSITVIFFQAETFFFVNKHGLFFGTISEDIPGTENKLVQQHPYISYESVRST
jgi:hypothetical protein